MEIIQNKTIKIVAIAILVVMLMSMTMPVFAAEKANKSAAVGNAIQSIWSFIKPALDAIWSFIKGLFTNKSVNVDSNTNVPAGGKTNGSGNFKLTYYSKEECGLKDGQAFGYGKNTNQFKIHPTLGCYTYDGYIVLAAATEELLKSSSKYTRKDYIHYFRYPDKITFTLNGTTYKGIIIDSCGASMKVGKNGKQILDVMFPTNDDGLKSGINQKVVEVKW